MPWHGNLIDFLVQSFETFFILSFDTIDFILFKCFKCCDWTAKLISRISSNDWSIDNNIKAIVFNKSTQYVMNPRVSLSMARAVKLIILSFPWMLCVGFRMTHCIRYWPNTNSNTYYARTVSKTVKHSYSHICFHSATCMRAHTYLFFLSEFAAAHNGNTNSNSLMNCLSFSDNFSWLSSERKKWFSCKRIKAFFIANLFERRLDTFFIELMSFRWEIIFTSWDNSTHYNIE